MKNRLLFLLIALLFNGLTASAQSWLWGAEGKGALKTDYRGQNIATDRTGNVYQTGGFYPSITFKPYTLTSPIGTNFYLVKYDENGSAVWAVQSDSGNGVTIGYSVATDDSDNSYSTGYSGPGNVFGNDTLFESQQVFIVKYDPNGNVVWATQPDTAIVNSTGYGIATDKFGHEYVTGFGSFLIKYDRNGNFIWAVTPTSTSSTIAYSVATDSYGNVYISGQFSGSLKFGTYTLYTSNVAVFIAKFDGNGNLLWAQQSTGASPGPQPFNSGFGGYSVATDQAGAAYLTGTFLSHTITFGSNTFTAIDSNYNFFVVKYNPGGTIAWGEEATPVNLNSAGGWGSYSVCTDDSNHIYISGAESESAQFSSSTPLIFANDTFSAPVIINGDAPSFLLKLDSSGHVLCGSIKNAGGYYPNIVTSDSTGRFVYMGGGFNTNLVFGADTLLANNGGFDTYVARWQSCNACNLAVAVTPLSATVCPGQSAVLTADGGTTYNWTPAASLSLSTGDSVIATPLVTTTYTVTGADSTGCLGFATTIVTVSSPPDTPTITQRGDTLISSAKQGNQWARNDSALTGATNQTYIVTIPGEYKVVTENPANGCSSTSDSAFYTPTGIEQLPVNSNQLTVYPNPTGGEINVTVSSSAMDVNDWNLQVTDVLGRTLLTKQSLNYNNEIDLSNLSSGVYFICVVNKMGKVVVPVVKQ